MTLQIIGNATGDAIVTTTTESVGINYARSGGHLPSPISVGFVVSDVPAGQLVEVDVRLNFASTLTSLSNPGFTLRQTYINGVLFNGTLAGTVLGPATLAFVFQNDSTDTDELLRGALVVVPS